MTDIPSKETTPGGAWTRETLAACPAQVLKNARSFVQPDIVLYDTPEGKYVLKDFSRRLAIFRNTWGRFVARREVAAYRRLDGMANVPRVIAVLDPYAFVMDYIDAAPLPASQNRWDVGLEFFDALRAMIAEMHRRGVAHGDLRKRNILITPDRQPCLIDFETAILDKGTRFSGWLFRKIAHVDDITVTKLKCKYFPRRSTAQEKQQLRSIPWHLRLGRFLRKRVYRPVSPKRMKARFARRDRPDNSDDRP